MWFKPIFLSGSLAVFEERGEPRRAGRAANHGGFPSPPAAAKFVRAILRIVHILELVKISASPLRGSAAKLNGIFQLIFLSLCFAFGETGKRKFFIIINHTQRYEVHNLHSQINGR